MRQSRYRRGLIAGGIAIIALAVIAGVSVGLPAITTDESSQSTPPEVQFEGSVDQANETAVLTHTGGDALDPTEVYRDSRQSASGLDPEGECRKLH